MFKTMAIVLAAMLLAAAPAPRGGNGNGDGDKCPPHDWEISGHIATCRKCGASSNVS